MPSPAGAEAAFRWAPSCVAEEALERPLNVSEITWVPLVFLFTLRQSGLQHLSPALAQLGVDSRAQRALAKHRATPPNM